MSERPLLSGARASRAESPRSEPGIDVYRGGSVVLMFLVHAARLVPPGEPPTFARQLLGRLLWAEPYIAASFLCLVGYGLTLSRERVTFVSPWRSRMLWRALGLYGIAVALFVLQYGVSAPDLVLSPGVLSAIALAVVLLTVALGSSWPLTVTSAIALVTIGGTALLDWTGVTLSGLNGGPGGAFPLLSFAALGALSRRLQRKRGARALDVTLALSAAVSLTAVATGLPWTTLQGSVYDDYGGHQAILGLLTGASSSPMRVSFWNHSAIGAIGLTFPLLFSLWVFTRRPALWASPRLLEPLHLIGRHALAAYVAHLIALGLLDAAGVGVPTSSWALACAGALAGLAALGGRLLESTRAR